MPDRKKPIELPEVVVTAQRTEPKKYREVQEKVRLYPKGEAKKSSIDSLRRAGYSGVIGDPIKQSGQADMYGTDQSDRIKKLLRK
jgi:hypothetical protein